ncbi:MAG: dipeptidase [Flavobacteriales bacterium]|nr:dipeptidase [Flavobacteriales bacterium]
MKKLAYLLLGLALIYWVITLIVPGIIDDKFNPVIDKGPNTVSNEARELYESLDFVGDLHCDALLWDRNLLKRNDHGQVDIPRMLEGNVALQAFTIVSKSPKGQNMQENTGETDNITSLVIAQGRGIDSWFSLYERAIDQCEALHRFAKKSDGKFRVVHDRNELQSFINDRKSNKQLASGYLGVEGGHCLEGKLENVDGLWNAGVRMMGPTHFFDNELGGSAHGVSNAGLTDFGKQVVRRMNELGMIIDVAHSSEAIIDDVLAMTTKPILTSHTGVKGMLNSQRNLSDDHLRGISETGGLIGVAFFPEAIGDPSAENIVKTMKYVKDLVGYQYVALGSDYDGSVTTQFDCTGFPLLVEEMLKQGFTEEEIRGIMGGNLKRFLLENLPQ